MNFTTRPLAALSAFAKANAPGLGLKPSDRRVYVCAGNADWDRALNNVDRDAAILLVQRTAATLPTIHAQDGGVLADVGEHMLATALMRRLVDAAQRARVNRAQMVELIDAAGDDVQAMMDAATYDVAHHVA